MLMMWRSWILVLGLMMFLVSFLPWYLQIVTIIVAGAYHLKRFRKGVVCFVLLLSVFVVRINVRLNKESGSDVYEVMEIKSNYVIVANEDAKMIAYGLENVQLGDIYELRGSVQEVDNVTNFHCFSFAKWAHRRNIYKSMNVKRAHLLSHGNKAAHRLYRYIVSERSEYKDFLLMMLYGIHQEEVTYLLIAAGIHVSFICGVLKRWMKQKRFAELCCIGLLVGIVWLTQPSGSMWRMLCFAVCRFVFWEENRMTKLGASMVLTLFLMPYMYCEMSFVLPVLFSLSSIFCLERYPRWFHSVVIMFPIQLIYYHKFSLIQTLSFRFVRLVYAVLYIYAWSLLMFPVNFVYQYIAEFIGVIEGFSSNENFVVGSIPVVLLLWYIEAVLCLYQRKSLKNHCIYGLCCLMIMSQYKWYPFTRIITLDVGQGDCSIIIEPFGREVIMIDVMGSLYKNIPKDIIVERLNTLGIRKIDTLIITHDDYDHSGGLNELKELVEVEYVISNKKEAKKYENDCLKLLLLDYCGKDENDNSIVTYYEVYDTSILFMGDLGISGEKELLGQYPMLKSDILKIGHHGSNTSSSLKFIHQVQPYIALISAGRNNFYNHPHKQVIDRLKNENVMIHITKEQGEADITITPWFSWFVNCNNEFVYKWSRKRP